MVKIYTMPAIPIESQVFYNPGAAWDGGLTAGGAQVIMPEPGGLSVLEMKPSVQDTEWISPVMSWLMSKTNGQVIRVKLAASPQVAWSRVRMDHLSYNWSDPNAIANDATVRFASVTAKGATTVTVNLATVGKILRPGHVIGHEFDCYLIDEITYAGDVATITITPPARRAIATNSPCLLNPWFTGRLQAGAQFKAMYNNIGHITPGTLIFNEAIV